MKIRLLTITNKVPSWVKEGYEEYAKRLPPSCQLELVEIPAEKRTNDLQSTKLREAKKILSVLKPQNELIALDVQGKMWSTEELSQQIANWQLNGKSVDLIVGGPEGLSDELLQKASAKWSLSKLTFPHFLVRIIVAEQIYRAHSLLQGHPYHR